MIEHLQLYLGPFIGFWATIGTIVFIALTAKRIEKPGGLEALQAQGREEQPETPTNSGSQG